MCENGGKLVKKPWFLCGKSYAKVLAKIKLKMLDIVK